MSLVTHNIDVDALLKRLVHAIDGTPVDGTLIVERPADVIDAMRLAASSAQDGDTLQELRSKALGETARYVSNRLNVVNHAVAQLFLNGPTWDGNLASKEARDAAVDLGFVYRHDGWQSLTPRGLRYALTIDFKNWEDRRYQEKQSMR